MPGTPRLRHRAPGESLAAAARTAALSSLTHLRQRFFSLMGAEGSAPPPHSLDNIHMSCYDAAVKTGGIWNYHAIP